jgi:hypothetical protein
MFSHAGPIHLQTGAYSNTSHPLGEIMKELKVSVRQKKFLVLIVALAVISMLLVTLAISSLPPYGKAQIMSFVLPSLQVDPLFSIEQVEAAPEIDGLVVHGNMSDTQIYFGQWGFQRSDGFILSTIFGLIIGLLSMVAFVYLAITHWWHKENFNRLIG